MTHKIKYLLMATLVISLLSDIHCMEKEQSNEVIVVLNQHTQEISQLKDDLKATIDNLLRLTNFTNNIVPIGVIIEYSGTIVLPDNWLECDGRAISRDDYPELLKVIRGTYGIGDGMDTFNIPDKRGRVAIGIDSNGSTNGLITNATAQNIALGKVCGEEMHQLTIPELPSHSHKMGKQLRGKESGATNNTSTGNIGTDCYNTANEGNNQPHNNIQPSIFMKYYIRAK